MGFRSPMNYTSVHHQIYMAGIEVCSHKNDGFTAWDIKQNIYRLKWLIDDILQKSPTFTDENEFVREHEKNVIFRALKE